MKFQVFEAQVSDGSGTANKEPLICRSFTQAKKFLLDWMLTRRFNVATGAPEVIAKPDVTTTITPRQIDFDYASEAEAKGFRPAREQDASMPAKTFAPVKNDKGEWCLSEVIPEVKELTPDEAARVAENRVEQLRRELAAAEDAADAALEAATQAVDDVAAAAAAGLTK